MTIIWVIAGVVELLLLTTLTGVLVTLTALFRLLELMIISVNPVCLYLLRQSGQIFTFLIVLTLRRTQQIPGKMCPSSTNERIHEPFIATIEPLPMEMEANLPNLQTTFVASFAYRINNNSDEAHIDDERFLQSEEILSSTLDQE